MTEKVFILEGLNCANCAGKIEEKTRNINGVENVFLDFVSKKLKVNIDGDNSYDDIVMEIKKIVNEIEPDVRVIEKEDNNLRVHSHEHGGFEESEIIKITVGAVLFLIPILFKLDGILEFIFFAASYIVVGGEILIRAGKNIFRGQVFDENFLMAVATLGAFAIGQYAEGVAVMLFYQVGEFFQGMAVNHSRKSIAALLDIRPDYANLVIGDEIKKVSPKEVGVGDTILIKPGEKIPLDGIIIDGSSMVDTSNITGENVPRSLSLGDMVLSGYVNNQGLLTIEVKKEFGESTVSKILSLVENASSEKAATENFITVFARYYTPIVVISAVFIALIPPLILGGGVSEWVYRALIFLVISCPCALVISIPLSFFGGIGGASKAGILIKGGNYLEALNQVDTIVMDKTGTLTKGVFKVTEIRPIDGYTEDDLLRYAAYGEIFSNHPIGNSILMAYGKEIDKSIIDYYKEIPGKGIMAKVNGDVILVGNLKLFKDNGISADLVKSAGSTVYMGLNGRYIGYIVISDEIKDGTTAVIEELKRLGIKKTIMLSGDRKEVAETVGNSIGIDKVYGELLPQDKVEKLEEIMLKNKKGKVAFIGDGVNDAPVLARADVGISMGSLGSDAAIEASDIVIMTDELERIVTGIKISNKTKKIVTENIIFALAVKLMVLILGALGIATMWEAVFADVGVSIIAILNSMRALKIEE